MNYSPAGPPPLLWIVLGAALLAAWVYATNRTAAEALVGSISREDWVLLGAAVLALAIGATAVAAMVQTFAQLAQSAGTLLLVVGVAALAYYVSRDDMPSASPPSAVAPHVNQTVAPASVPDPAVPADDWSLPAEEETWHGF